MKLPLDHFRLLGIKPKANKVQVEQVLAERLENPPSSGYSQDTLNARAQLLQASSSVLTDEQRCQAHDPDKGELPGIELEPGQEVAAPLLLLEAQENFKAFELALELLSRQGEGAAFHGQQQADLLLMATLAARRASQEMYARRLYDQSAQILERAIQLLADHACQGRRKAILEDDLNKISPFRILDLLSQESSTALERQRGLSSLKEFIDRRGGLDRDDDEQCSPLLFQDFFKQVRPCLTIDEQLELFEGYNRQEASTATFLLAYTRTAAGFQRRQPAHVDAALTAMEAVDAEGLEPEKACLLLLLGQPDAAQDMARSCKDPRLCQWLASYPPTSDSLLGLCSFCSQWLEQHVLPCYRDVDPHAKVDLDAYFLDPEVQRYINDRDSLPAPRSKAHGEAKPKRTKDLALFTLVKPAKPAEHTPRSQPTRQQQDPLPAPPPNHWSDGPQSSGFPGGMPPPMPSPKSPGETPGLSAPAARGSGAVDFPPTWQQRQTLWPLAAKSALAVGVTVALVALLRPWSMFTTSETPDSPPPQLPPSPPDAVVGNTLPPPPPVTQEPILFDPPQIRTVQGAQALDPVGVKILLRAWLDVKSAVLHNTHASQPTPETLDALALLAVPEQVATVMNQQQRLREQGEQLQVNSTLGNVSLLTQTANQVSARVEINYTETTVNREGITTNTFGPTVLRNDYTFIRGQQGWKLLGFSPSPP